MRQIDFWARFEEKYQYLPDHAGWTRYAVLFKDGSAREIIARDMQDVEDSLDDSWFTVTTIGPAIFES